MGDNGVAEKEKDNQLIVRASERHAIRYLRRLSFILGAMLLLQLLVAGGVVVFLLWLFEIL